MRWVKNKKKKPEIGKPVLIVVGCYMVEAAYWDGKVWRYRNLPGLIYDDPKVIKAWSYYPKEAQQT